MATGAVLTLAGCAPGGAAIEPSADALDVSTELTADTVELTIADETGFPVTEKLADEFTKQHPNITFKFNRDTFANLTATDDVPDLIRLPTIGETVKDGLLANLDPYFDAYGWDTWSESQLAPLRVSEDGVRGSGSLYQLGLGYSITGIYMNTKLAAQVGIDAPPTTLGELEDDFAKAKAAGILPLMTDDGGFNSRRVQAAEIPAAGGIATARALAAIWSATVVETDGVRLLDRATTDAATRVQSEGAPAFPVTGPFPRWGMGFQLDSEARKYLTSNGFGHDGAGGQVAFAEPDLNVGFAFTTNLMEASDPRATAVVDALRGVLTS